MPYSAEISRKNPGCIMFLLDQSGSMAEPFGKQKNIRKADGAADAINSILRAIIFRCTKETGVRDYFEVSVIGYGAREGYVGPLLGEKEKFVKISWLYEHPLRIEEKIEETPKGEKVRVRLPIWFEPVAENGTPMCAALQLAYNWIKEWIEKHPNSFPPIVFNITDGIATDGDPEPYGKKIMELATSDGNALLFNCHISGEEAEPIIFPTNEEELPNDEYARKLFRMSSELPEPMIRLGDLRKGSKGFAFNADLAALINFLDIGTRPALDQLK
ncbi:MAG: vWA domain-containing protein [Candidatus Bathyarchaeia archaeon]